MKVQPRPDDKVGLDPHRSQPRLVQLYGGGARVAVLDMKFVSWDILAPVWQRPLVAHNAAFELAFLAKRGIYPRMQCTMQAAGLLLGVRRRSLADACSAYLGVDCAEGAPDVGLGCADAEPRPARLCCRRRRAGSSSVGQGGPRAQGQGPRPGLSSAARLSAGRCGNGATWHRPRPRCSRRSLRSVGRRPCQRAPRLGRSDGGASRRASLPIPLDTWSRCCPKRSSHDGRAPARGPSRPLPTSWRKSRTCRRYGRCFASRNARSCSAPSGRSCGSWSTLRQGASTLGTTLPAPSPAVGPPPLRISSSFPRTMIRAASSLPHRAMCWSASITARWSCAPPPGYRAMPSSPPPINRASMCMSSPQPRSTVSSRSR